MLSCFLKKKASLLIILFIGSLLFSQTQEESWETFITKKDKGFMAVTVNMEFHFTRPNYKNLLVVGTQTSKCLKNGYPKEEGLEKLYAFSDSIANIVGNSTRNKLAGILTYQCAGFDVFYVKDTIGLRKKINSFIGKNYSTSKNYVSIGRDKYWKYYQEHLFPKDISNDFFVNQEFISQLFYDGDALTDLRNVEHWIYFRKEKRRQKFIDKIQVLNFKVDSLKFVTNRNEHFELKISREDAVNPQTISEITALLKNLSRSFNGVYDGWGTEPILKD